MAEIKRITIITGDHHEPDPTKRNASYNEEDMVTHNAMVDAFRSHQEFQFDVMNDHRLFLDYFRETPPDLVVNFCDTGYRNVPTQELNVPAYLELLGIPYTGAPPAAMVLCYDKQLVRLISESMGVPVPWEEFISANASLDDLPEKYPALIKPNTADGSVGITKHAVVHNEEKAREYLKWMRQELPGRDALFQEYLPGPEYGMGIIGNPESGFRPLPALEVDFSGLPDDCPPILSYESKALPSSPYWTEIHFRRATLPPETEQQMATWAETLFKRFGLRDYARFDFRTGADGQLKLMEVNPNPAWANDGKLAFMASFAEIEYPQMLRMILDTAIARL